MRWARSASSAVRMAPTLGVGSSRRNRPWRPRRRTVHDRPAAGRLRPCTDGGTSIPSARSGAGRGSPQTGASGTTPAQAGPAMSSGSSSGQPSEIRSDQSSRGSARTRVAASSAKVVPADLGDAAGQQPVGDEVEHVLLVLGDGRAGAEDDRRAVVDGRLEGAAGHDQPVVRRDGERRRHPGGEPAHPPRAGRAVAEHPVAVADHGGRQDRRGAVVGDQGEVPHQGAVEEGVERGAVGAGQLGQPDPAARRLQSGSRGRTYRRPGRPGRPGGATRQGRARLHSGGASAKHDAGTLGSRVTTHRTGELRSEASAGRVRRAAGPSVAGSDPAATRLPTR